MADAHAITDAIGSFRLTEKQLLCGQHCDKYALQTDYVIVCDRKAAARHHVSGIAEDARSWQQVSFP